MTGTVWIRELALRFETNSGHALVDLSSRRRSEGMFRGRIELTMIAVCRYGLRVCDVASVLGKHRNSVTKWLNTGLREEGDDPEFRRRLDDLEAAISKRC